MSLPKFQAVEPPDPSDENREPAVLRLSALRLFDALKGQARFLSPMAQFLFFASGVLLVVMLPVLVALDMLGRAGRLDESASAVSAGLLLLGAMAVLSLLGRRSDRRRASDAFGKQVDRRPRF